MTDEEREVGKGGRRKEDRGKENSRGTGFEK